MKFAGPALTVEVRPGDNLMIHAAMAIAKPGDVIIVDGKGDLSSALMGEIMCQQCVALGVAAVVIDGAVRDSVAIRELGLPMYAAGLNPNGRPSSCPAVSITRSRSAASASIPVTCWSAMPTA
jgi:regulator of RNase E activity RraA